MEIYSVRTLIQLMGAAYQSIGFSGVALLGFAENFETYTKQNVGNNRISMFQTK